MTTFFCVPTLDFSGQKSQFTIATAAVVISQDHTRVLLHKGNSIEKWQFLGGRYDDSLTFRENALEKAREILGENTLELFDEDEPYVIFDTIDLRGYDEKTLLIHYRTILRDEENTADAAWFTLDEVRMLDAKNETSSENILLASEHFLK